LDGIGRNNGIPIPVYAQNFPCSLSPTPYERYVLDEDYEFRQSTVRYVRETDEFYLHLTIQKYDGDDTDGSADTEHRSVLGIDLGVNSLAVSSTGVFWQGDDYDHWVREFEKRRAKMQQCGGQDAHEALLRLGRRERAWRKQYIHTLANDIVSEAVETNCSTVVFEDLDGIRERLPQAKWHHIWAFRRLYEYVAYKAPGRGIAIEIVEPNHTSQRCSRCGFTHENNRNGGSFACQKCGYELHADYNAAKNIGLRYARNEHHRLHSSQMSSGGDAPVDVRLNRGTMTDDGPRPIAGD
jgi:putative transposase